MTLLTYQVFKTIADVGSFHKAADILGLTPSAISHAISSMENELGFSVLTRSKAGVSLTNYGEQLLPYVNAVLNCDESLKQEIAELNGLKQGKVYTVDARKISVQALGKYFPNSPMLAAAVAVSGVMKKDAFISEMRTSYQHKFAKKPEEHREDLNIYLNLEMNI